MTWNEVFEQLCTGREVARESFGESAYIYRRRISNTEDHCFQFVRVDGNRKVIFEMRWKPDYDDLVATDWKHYERK